MDPLKFFMQLNNSEDTVDQEPKDNLADTMEMLKELGGEEAAKIAFERSKIQEHIIFNTLAHRVAQLDAEGKSEQLCLTVAAQVNSKLPGLNAAKVLELVKNRDN